MNIWKYNRFLLFGFVVVAVVMNIKYYAIMIMTTIFFFCVKWIILLVVMCKKSAHNNRVIFVQNGAESVDFVCVVVCLEIWFAQWFITSYKMIACYKWNPVISDMIQLLSQIDKIRLNESFVKYVHFNQTNETPSMEKKIARRECLY